MQKIKILIIDESQPFRRNAMKLALENYAQIYFYTEKKVVEAKYFSDKRNVSITDFDLIMVHIREKKRLRKYSSKNCIWYGGGGINDEALPKDAIAIIRPIPTEYEALTPKEGKEIVYYFSGASNKFPSVLFNPSYEQRYVNITHFIDQLKEPIIVDWDKIVLIDELQGYQKEWFNFKREVINLIEVDKNLHPFDNQFLELYERFISIVTQPKHNN